jgi:hypothetical protein
MSRPARRPQSSRLAEFGGREMSFNICRGTLGSLALFTAIRDKECLVAREQLCTRSPVETTDGWIYGEVPLSRCGLATRLLWGDTIMRSSAFFPAFIATPGVGKDRELRLTRFSSLTE